MKLLNRSIQLIATLLLAINSGFADIVHQDLILVSKQRIDRFNYDYTYKLRAQNTDSYAVSQVQANVGVRYGSSSYQTGQTRILEPYLTFDTIQGRSTALSSDTFTLRHDRRYAFNPDDLDIYFSVRNYAPVANAGNDHNLQNGGQVQLDGHNSRDNEYGNLSYEWKLLASPADSGARLIDSSSATPVLTTDKAGTYLAQLVVNDGTLASIPDVVRVNVSRVERVVTDEIQIAFGADPAMDDTDNDGIADADEIRHATGYLLPGLPDSNNNGVNDASDDLDGDGLSNAQEIALGTSLTAQDTDGDGLSDSDEYNRSTNPLNPDSDGDGLLDGHEIAANTNPTNPDSDSDGIPDGQDIVSIQVGNNSTATVELTALGYIGNEIEIHAMPPASSQYHNARGQIGAPVEINLSASGTSRLQEARVTLAYDPASIGSSNPQNLRVFTYDEELHFWVPAAQDQIVDSTNHTVTATVAHFSRFAVFDISNWSETWTADAEVCASRTAPVDTVLVIDSSGSMSGNDPDNLRLRAARNFVSALIEQDRGAVVDFDSYGRIVQGLTNSKSALYSAISSVDSSGGTNIGAGVSPAINMLTASASNERGRIVIVLTDGYGSYNSSLTSLAATNNITIYTIGLGSSVDSGLLSSIAAGTGGRFNQVISASDLPAVYRRIEIDSGVAGGTDTDGDGLTDEEETNGVVDITGQVFFSDPNLTDSDGDGLSDYEEVGRPLSIEQVRQKLAERGISVQLPEEGCYHNVTSDPQREDTDGDGLEDGLETDGGEVSDTSGNTIEGMSDPRIPDTDGDGLTDAQEFEWQTNLRSGDTDGDGFGDAYETSNMDNGFHPLEFTVVKSTVNYISEFAWGAICGDFCDLDTVPELAGQIVVGISPLGPVGDIRDTLALAIQGEWVGSGLSLAGVVPVFGDAAKIGSASVKFVTRNADKADEVLQLLLKNNWVPESAKRDLLTSVGEAALRNALNTLKNAGFSDDVLVRLAKGKVPGMQALADAVSRRGASVANDLPGFLNDWRVAENILRAGIQRPGRFPKGDPKNFIRYPDAVVDKVAMEAKNGYVKMSSRIRKQIEKDAELIRRGEVDAAEWHFFPSGRSDSIGADKEVLDLLDYYNITYTFHLPN